MQTFLLTDRHQYTWKKKDSLSESLFYIYDVV